MKGETKFTALVECFNKHKKEDFSDGVASMKTLMEFLEKDDSTTMQEFVVKMKQAREELCKSLASHISVRSSCELFVRFITLSQKELEQAEDFKSCRSILLKRGQTFIEDMNRSTNDLVRYCKDLIKSDMNILTHSMSKNVLQAMLKSAESGKQFKVYVTEARPSCDGYKMVEELKSKGISATVILDSAIAYIMEKIDVIIIGAEAVCKNGGIINRIGTYTMASLSRLKNKPVYVLAESFKFIRFMPLNNSSLPEEFLYSRSTLMSKKDIESEHPNVDYTPPECITLLYTNLGVLPTSAVSEYLIDLYT